MAKTVQSTGNVFADLDFAPAEAANLKIRSTLMAEIAHVIQERNLTQVVAADLYGVSQPRMSDLVRGRIDLFNIDALVAMLARSGADIDVQVVGRSPAA